MSAHTRKTLKSRLSENARKRATRQRKVKERGLFSPEERATMRILQDPGPTIIFSDDLPDRSAFLADADRQERIAWHAARVRKVTHR